MNHFNKLDPAEAERLALLMEECGEVVQVIGKILRHGYESHHPDGGESNRILLHNELGDLKCATDFMIAEGDLVRSIIEECAEAKSERVGKYLHHQDNGGFMCNDKCAAHNGGR